LSVGERMFYFLDAIHSTALCRPCVMAAEQSLGLPVARPAGPSVPRIEVPLAYRGARASLPRRPSGRGPHYPFFEEYLADIDSALEDLPRNGRLVTIVRQLRTAAIQLWERGEAFRGLLIARRLWTRLRELDLLPPPNLEEAPVSIAETLAELDRQVPSPLEVASVAEGPPDLTAGSPAAGVAMGAAGSLPLVRAAHTDPRPSRATAYLTGWGSSSPARGRDPVDRSASETSSRVA
jgi:hypothetical protein